MKKPHILLRKATATANTKPTAPPEGYRYEAGRGAWIAIARPDEFLVATKDNPKPRTKKFEVETGEDQKDR